MSALEDLKETAKRISRIADEQHEKLADRGYICRTKDCYEEPERGSQFCITCEMRREEDGK